MNLKVRVAAVMFLSFFVIGTWVPMIGLVLSKHGMGSQIGNAFSCLAIASLCTPFLTGYFVDKYFSAERVMTGLHVVGAGLLTCMPSLIDSESSVPTLITLFFYCLLFMPTFSLMNNIAFVHVEKAEKMPYIRLFANVGWVVPGFIIGAAGMSASTSIFYVAAVSSLCLGLIAYTLPSKAPTTSAKAKTKLGTLQNVLILLRNRSFAILLVGMIIISIPKAFYYAYTSTFADAVGFGDVGSTLSIGQLSEVFAIASIPFLIKKIGYRWIILTGMLAWVGRYLLFSIGSVPANQPLVFLAIAIYGICYDFLFVTVVIFAEKIADEHSKAQAQGIVVLCTTGLGQLIGAQISRLIYNDMMPSGASGVTLELWKHFWLYPAGAAAVAFLVIYVGFRPNDAHLTRSRHHAESSRVESAA